MASVRLVFNLPPVPAGPVRLIYGEDDGTIYEATLSAILPSISFGAVFAPSNDATLAATLPAPTFSGYLVPPNDATLQADLPGLTFAAEALVLTGLVYEAELAATLPAPTFAARIVPPNDAILAATLPGLTLAASAVFDLQVSRPTVGSTASAWQVARPASASVVDASTSPRTMPITVAAAWQVAQPASANVEARKPRSLHPFRHGPAARHAEALLLRTQSGEAFGNLLRRRAAQSTRHQDADPLRAANRTSHQDRYRDRRPSLTSRHSQALALRRGLGTSHAPAVPHHLGRAAPHQEAIRPPAGYGYQLPEPPLPEPCYTPSTRLVFADPFGATSRLIFICDNHTTPVPGTVVVPVREVYMITNNVRLLKVSDGTELPVLTMDLDLDADSWTWGFSATLPGYALGMLGDLAGVELEAIVNGVSYRVRSELPQRSRQFGSSVLQLTGRGRSAELAAPYAPVKTFANTAMRTAQQLMADVLTVNGAPLPWTVDWQLTDWLVPAGAWSTQGSYMDALVNIASAAGGYVQPHRTDQTLRILPRFPVPSWAWAGADIDFELPSAVVSVEGIAWADKPLYNRVFLSGTSALGVLGQITRDGTAGDLIAPMVTDPLFTADQAVRQRGTAILSDVGRTARVTLRLPALAETGLIEPGKFVRYTDPSEADRVGLTRGLRVSADGDSVWQTLEVDTYV